MQVSPSTFGSAVSTSQTWKIVPSDVLIIRQNLHFPPQNPTLLLEGHFILLIHELNTFIHNTCGIWCSINRNDQKIET